MEWNRRCTYLTVLMLCICLPITATAAVDLSVVWNMTYGGTGGNDSAYAIIEPPNGSGYLFAGKTGSYGAGGTDAWVVALTGDGDEVGNMTYGRGENDTARALVPVTENRTLFAGTYTFITDNTRRDTDAWAVMIDGSGAEVWNEKYGGAAVNATANAATRAKEGGYLLAGSVEPYGTGRTDALVVKVNESGGEEWNMTYGAPGGNETAYAIAALPDGGYGLAGSTDSGSAGGTDAWIVRLDGNGSEVWNRTCGGPDNDTARSLVAAPDGSLLFAGTYTSRDGQNRTDTDALVVRLTGDGEVVWNATYGSPADNASAYALILTNDGGSLFAGERAAWGMRIPTPGSSNSTGTDPRSGMRPMAAPWPTARRRFSRRQKTSMSLPASSPQDKRRRQRPMPGW